jgi:hypothetical protein
VESRPRPRAVEGSTQREPKKAELVLKSLMNSRYLALNQWGFNLNSVEARNLHGTYMTGRNNKAQAVNLG